MDYDDTFDYGNAIRVEYVRIVERETYLAPYSNPLNPECATTRILNYDGAVKIITSNIFGNRLLRFS